MAERPRSSTQPELDPLIGLTVSGRYRVHALIGQGGMGKVFRAQQIPLGRAVALKVLEAARVDQEFQRRFFQEAAILAKLQSRHTVTIFDYGRDGDLYFIAMELISGSSLDRVIASQGPLPWPRALSIAQQICRSLREAHAQGVIHRDLKPANVVITQTEDGDELAKVLDFGLAKRIDRVSTEDTQADTVPGSPKYMAPEVIRQQAVDGRADMYGLGVMLYQMLTGVVPFDRENPMDILIAHLHERPRPPREVNPKVEIPGQLEHLVMRCLAKTPGERFADMATLLETLRALSAELGVTSEASWAGKTLVPDAPSGVHPAVATEPLRLDAGDLRVRAPAVPRKRVSPVALAAFGGGALIAVGLYFAITSQVPSAPPAKPPEWRPVPGAPQAAPAAAARAPATNAPAAPGAAPTPTAPASGGVQPSAAQPTVGPVQIVASPQRAPAAPPNAPGAPSGAPGSSSGAKPGAPDMVIDEDETDTSQSMPSVRLRVRSDPPGAVVLVQHQRMGTTPVSFEFRDPQAKVGGQLSVDLRLSGYQPYTVVRTVDAFQIEIYATLEEAYAEPAPSAPEQPTHKTQPSGQSSPVLKVTPSDPEP